MTATITLDEALNLSINVLIDNGFSKNHAQSIARVIWACQRDECQSHGLYRLLVCVHTLRSGKVSPDAEPEISDAADTLVRVDAKGAYSLLAFDMGRPLLVEKSKRHGMAALAINHCYHFSALWPEIEAIAAEGLVAIAMTPSHSWVAPYGGTKGVFGTNPIAFAWPRPGGNPFVFDFATSAAARGEIELHRRAGKAIPEGWAVDKDGNATTDAEAAMSGAMLTFGGYKGSALSAMIELMAGPLIGDFLSLESQAYDAGTGATPYHGELIIAINPKTFMGPDWARHTDRAEALFNAIIDQGARLPSQRRYEARARSLETGAVTIPAKLYEDILALLKP
ncbi:Ldh family oxidoreductase [Asticcacaulis sp. SL142]|uniref:Ldh family oxidoreductase n=1 Tax=Asticcacaulis sp. SL142 TaxID=2995155 RepID=UPI00226D045D|nr:Ldh family oxidoreductase [Asticcacaulis sp. SL142]WAC48882.1 Ldh family oxidoreductase [Asticcacaulis sp. SL142]